MRGSVSLLSDSKYEIIRELGRGGMGVVYLAKDTRLERQVALKMLHPNLAQSEKAIAAFRREAHAVGSLYHPHIIHVNSLEMVQDSLCIDMPFLPGGSMRDRITQGMSYTTLARILADCLDALACCHEAGIVHCDVKPSNLLFDGSGSVKLSDFGLAKLERVAWAEAITVSASTVVLAGTPKYMCPEAWSGAEPTAQQDIYALGMVAREVITGHIPYEGDTPYAFHKSVVETPLLPLREEAPELSEPFAQLLDAMVEKAPQDRPESANEILAALRACPEHAETAAESEATIPPRPISRSSSVSLRRRRTIPWRPIALAALLLVIAGLGLWAARNAINNSPATIAAAPPPTAVNQGEAVHMLVAADPKQAPWLLLVREQQDSDNLEAMANTDRAIWSATFTPNADGAYDLAGTWAQFGNAEGVGFDWGEVSGTVRLENGVAGRAWYSLRFESAAHPNRWEEALVSQRVNAPEDAAAFVGQFETAPASLPLLYNELAQRDPAYLAEFARFLPAHNRFGIAAARLPVETLPNIDGDGSEAAWQTAGIEPQEGSSLRYPSTLVACYEPRGLYLKFQVDAFTSEQWELALNTIGAYQVPMTSAPHYQFTVTPDGVSGTVVRGAARTDLANPALTAYSETGGRLTVELFVPWRNIGVENPDRFRHVVRMDAALQAAIDGAMQIVTEWGSSAAENPVPQMALRVPILAENAL